MRMDVVNERGELVETIEADDRVFGIRPHAAALHQAVVAHLANLRAGTASTKTRGEVRGSTVKIRRQKGSGRARQGSIRAPHHRHGGIVFGPRPRDWSQDLPRQMRRLAIRSALSAKAVDGQLRVVDRLLFERPGTRHMRQVLQALELPGSALVVTDGPDRNVLLSARNLEKVSWAPVGSLSAYELMRHQALVMTVGAVRRAEELWGGAKARAGRVLPQPPHVRAVGGEAAEMVGQGRTPAPQPAAPASEAPAAEGAPPAAQRRTARRTARRKATGEESGSDA